MSNETTLSNKVSKYLKERRDCWFIKTHGSAIQKGGVPDYLICYKGRFLGIELKRPEKSYYDVTARQKANLDRIAKCGGISGYGVKSVEELDLILKEIE